MRHGPLILGCLLGLAGCSYEIPDFLGREGAGTGAYQLRPDPPPEPVAIPLRDAVVDQGLYGLILRVYGVAPTQGYYAGDLLAENGGEPDAAGVLAYQLVAVPPDVVEAVGPTRTREIEAALFIPALALKKVKTVRITGADQVRTLRLP
ncbi:MAG: hypothetical protein H6896_05125 [Rhodovulum sp.]|nr:hypothetical protein [Paracoccaceae bacterium]MCC0066388.1 hypothetical protein [Rhodovulum sp.]